MSRVAFEKVAYREGPDGLLAVVDAVGRAVGELRTIGDDLVLLTQGVEKPGNLGAMLRTADAVGVDAVVAADPVTDWGNPNVVRASKATVFSVPVARGSTGETLEWVRTNGIRLVVTTPETSVEHTDIDWSGPVAVAVGSEKQGADAVRSMRQPTSASAFPCAATPTRSTSRCRRPSCCTRPCGNVRTLIPRGLAPAVPQVTTSRPIHDVWTFRWVFEGGQRHPCACVTMVTTCQWTMSPTQPSTTALVRLRTDSAS